MATQIPPELAAVLGTKDPAAAMMRMFTKATTPLREIHDRVVKRSGVLEVVIADLDPKKAGKQAARISVAKGSTNPATLANQWAAMIVVKGKAGLYIDEAKRYLLKQPIGTSKSLDAEEAPTFDRESIDLLQATAAVGGFRSLFVVDDVMIISVGIPILCALIPILLPMIIEWGAGVWQSINPNASSKDAAPEPTGTIPEGEVGMVIGGETYAADPKMLLVAGLGLLGLIWYMRHKG